MELTTTLEIFLQDQERPITLTFPRTDEESMNNLVMFLSDAKEVLHVQYH